MIYYSDKLYNNVNLEGKTNVILEIMPIISDIVLGIMSIVYVSNLLRLRKQLID